MKSINMPEIKSLLRSGKRILITIDDSGVHFRETLLAISNMESGEMTYDAKPIGSVKHPKKFRKCVLELLKH